MKKLLCVLAVLAFAVPAFAGFNLEWQAAAGATGYRVSYKTLAATTYTQVDAGNVVSWPIPTTLVKGTRYEFYVQAYTGTTTKSYSGDSDHLRWTYPADPTVIELPAAPSSLIINFTP